MDDEQLRREGVFSVLDVRTAEEWDADPRNGLSIMSWSDYGHYANRGGHGEKTSLVTWAQFQAYRAGATIQMKKEFTWETIDGITPKADDE